MQKRWGAEGIGYKGQPFYNAIQKYGWDNFDHEIIAESLTQDEAGRLEQVLIKTLHSHIKENGYNVDLGGINSIIRNKKKIMQLDSEYNLIEEFDDISAVIKAYPNFNEGSIRSNCNGHSVSCYGYFWRYSDDTNGIENLKRDKLQITKTEKIPVYQFNIYGDLIAEYPSIDKASAVTGIPHPNIHNCCIGSYSHAGKFIWKHKEDVSDLEEFKRTLDTSIFDEFKEIYQFDMDLNFIAEYENANAATKINTKLVSNSILDCCRNIYRYSNDYIWQFKCNVPDIMAFKNEYTHKNRKPTTHSPVLQYDKNMNFIREFQSAKEAAAFYDCDSHTITYACSGRNKTGLGFIWKYKYPEQVKSSKTLLQLDENMNILRSFDSVDEAAKHVGYKSSSSIRKCCTRGISGKGFYWMYKDDYCADLSNVSL